MDKAKDKYSVATRTTLFEWKPRIEILLEIISSYLWFSWAVKLGRKGDFHDNSQRNLRAWKQIWSFSGQLDVIIAKIFNLIKWGFTNLTFSRHLHMPLSYCSSGSVPLVFTLGLCFPVGFSYRRINYCMNIGN